MKENVTLLQEINDLKKEKHTLSNKIRVLNIQETGGLAGLGSTARSKMDMSVRSKGE